MMALGLKASLCVAAESVRPESVRRRKPSPPKVFAPKALVAESVRRRKRSPPLGSPGSLSPSQKSFKKEPGGSTPTGALATSIQQLLCQAILHVLLDGWGRRFRGEANQ
jgi:hypothetical protein